MKSYLLVSVSKATLGLALAGALALGGCQKEDAGVCGGTPTLSSVTSTTDRSSTSTTGALADWVILHGTNLCNVSKVSFNDVDVSLADAYVTASEITVQVPRTIPKSVTNTVTVTTAGGTAQTSYKLSIPPMTVAGLSNEYTAPGQKAAVVGSNFDLYDVSPTKGKILWNGTAVAVTRNTADSVFFVVPASATPGATLKVVDGNGKETAVPGRYKDDRNIVFGYDTNGSVWGSNTFITTGPTPAPVNGPFVRINQTIGDWGWTEFSTHNNIVLPADLATNSGNYVLRFEMNTRKPFSANAVRFSIDGNADNINTYNWAPKTPYSTRGQWSTVTIPLSSFITKPDDLKKPLHECKFVFIGPGVLDADISFDTFRIVPKD